MIGILYICTGKYDIFWKKFYQTCERYFLPGQEKRYFVFTDAKHIYGENDKSKIKKIYQQTLGWPYNTLFRFGMFLNAETLLAECDYLFFFNANIVFVDKISSEILPDDSNDGLLSVKHPGFWNKSPVDFPYDRNAESKAFIPQGEGEHYFMGGFNGGKTQPYLQLIKDLNANIHADLEKDVIALWHDESHLNRYLLTRNPKILSPAYGFAEGYIMPFKPKLIILNKNKFGGLDYLRNISDKKKRQPSRVVQFIDKALRKTYRKFRGLLTNTH